jgi:hypothetical protein
MGQALGAILLVLACSACAMAPPDRAARAAVPVADLKPAEPQPMADELAPGLAVRYTYAIVNSLGELKGRKFEPGPPLSHLTFPGPG